MHRDSPGRAWTGFDLNIIDVWSLLGLVAQDGRPDPFGVLSRTSRRTPNGSGLRLISAPVGRGFRDSCWSCFGASEVFDKASKRCVKKQEAKTLWDQNINERSQAMGGTRAEQKGILKDIVPTWKASVALLSGYVR